MDDKLLIEVLKLLEETYPESYEVGILTNKLGIPLLGEFSKIIRFLRKTDKIRVEYSNISDDRHRKRVRQGDRIFINEYGIDFLDQKKLLIINEKRNKIIKWATIVIALSAIISLIIGILNYYKS